MVAAVVEAAERVVGPKLGTLKVTVRVSSEGSESLDEVAGEEGAESGTGPLSQVCLLKH